MKDRKVIKIKDYRCGTCKKWYRSESDARMCQDHHAMLIVARYYGDEDIVDALYFACKQCYCAHGEVFCRGDHGKEVLKNLETRTLFACGHDICGRLFFTRGEALNCFSRPHTPRLDYSKDLPICFDNCQ